MKITVITDRGGKILGTMRQADNSHEDLGRGRGVPRVQLIPGSGQKATALDLSDDVASGSAEELHARIAAHLKRTRHGTSTAKRKPTRRSSGS